MKKIQFILFVVLNQTIFAQNVGIGVSEPKESLDVGGNINLTGSILASSVKGKPGQTLQINSFKEMVWADICDYKNFKQFFYTGTSETFNIPNGVTTIVAEVWSGGGGGSGTGAVGNGAGGGGSAYAKVMFDVSNESSLTIVVGAGGTGGTSSPTTPGIVNPTSGGSSTIESSTQRFTMPGGAQATVASYGLGGSTANATGLGFGIAPVYILIPGHAGALSDHRYSQFNATDFVEQNYYGKGGDAGTVMNSGGNGGYYKIVGTTGVTKPSGIGNSFGAGGGGGHTAGANGANGTVILHW